MLSIAGSDSSGGAGIQADLRVLAALGVHGATAITAVTAQSTVEVACVHPIPPELVRAQLGMVLADLPVSVVKTGMLASATTVEVVAELLAEWPGPALVVDPVLVSSSGVRLLDPAGERALSGLLFPRASLITPNLDEAATFTGCMPRNPDEMADAGRMLLRTGARAVLVKGGHLKGDPIDVLVEPDGGVLRLPGPRVGAGATHGTGCTYASAIAGLLARGFALQQAVEAAHELVSDAIRAAARLGKGRLVLASVAVAPRLAQSLRACPGIT